MDKKYHFFIPYVENGTCAIIHWSDTVEGFKSTVEHKREYEPQFTVFASNPSCLIFDPKKNIIIDQKLDRILKQGCTSGEIMGEILREPLLEGGKPYYLFIPNRNTVIFRIFSIEKHISIPQKIWDQNPFCRILNPKTMLAQDFWLSEILRPDFLDEIGRL